MSRKAGTPNKPKVEKFIPVGDGKDFMLQAQKDMLAAIEKGEIPGLPKQENNIPAYLVVQANDIDSLNQVVRAEMACYKYVCQGGVSVTNYRGLDGKIVMVYCQAMVRKE
jgi:hypothetical protein